MICVPMLHGAVVSVSAFEKGDCGFESPLGIGCKELTLNLAVAVTIAFGLSCVSPWFIENKLMANFLAPYFLIKCTFCFKTSLEEKGRFVRTSLSVPWQRHTFAL
jgi:hypothetical protein